MQGWMRPLLLGLWAGLIFGTSCTVLRPAEFFDLVAAVTGAQEESMQRFGIFWGVSWFAIVKGWHFAEFFVLTWFTVAVIKWWWNVVTPATVGGAMLLCVVFAASDEWHQSFVPDRFGTVQDVLIDSLGVCVAGSVWLLRLSKSKPDGQSAESSGEMGGNA
jgi:hypothetical protein